jgi:cytochrome c peroxidase
MDQQGRAAQFSVMMLATGSSLLFPVNLLSLSRENAMRTRLISIFIPVLIAIAAATYFTSCRHPAVLVDPAQLQMFNPLPDEVDSQNNPLSAAKENLGRMLYYESRLSKDQKTSCNSCHQLAKYGVDGQPVSDGFKGQKGTRNAPTVYNAAGHIAQFWDGRAPDVEEQAKGPVMNPVEMAMSSSKDVVAVLKSMPRYVDAFKQAFPGQKDPVTFENAALAIGAFERRLLTPSRWDRFLKGDRAALTDAEKAGFNKFMDAGCQACHAGTYLGGQLYQKLGAVLPYPDTSDPGRQAVTKQESDRLVFKVPSLRNIDQTAPYFHTGKVANLHEAVKEMGQYQLGKQLSDAEITSIITFLKSLTGEIPAEYVKPPELPKSTPQTPKPATT